MDLEPLYGDWSTSFALSRWLLSLASLEIPYANLLYLMLTFASTQSGLGFLL
jgi:hypothetical protein